MKCTFEWIDDMDGDGETIRKIVCREHGEVGSVILSNFDCGREIEIFCAELQDSHRKQQSTK